MTHYADRLTAAMVRKHSRVCVGLDPRSQYLPEVLRHSAARGPEQAAEAHLRHCCMVLEAVAPHVVAAKPQAAFFEALGPAGYAALWQVIAYARAVDLIVILDAKRSDIGSTAAAYAEAYLTPVSGLTAPDAMTVNGYLGSDGVMPFVTAARETGRGIYVLAKTSNPSSGELQDLPVTTPDGSRPLYQEMGRLIAQWGREAQGECGYSAVGAVVGATYPHQLTELRQALPTVPFLVPGYGAQGGGAADVVGAFDTGGRGAVVSSSRAIAYAHEFAPDRERYGAADFPEAARAAAADMQREINAALGDTV